MAALMESAWREEAHRERRRTGLLLSVSLAVLLAMLVFGLAPIRREAGRLAEELERVEAEIHAAGHARGPGRAASPWSFGRFRPAGPSGKPLPDERARNALGREKRRQDRLEAEWADLRIRVATFSGETALKQVLGAPEEGRIDFKVSLFNARTRIAEAARAAGMRFPAELGVPETIGATESAEVRLWQLAASVRFLELCMASGIPAVLEIETLPPQVRAPRLEGYPALHEYPLRIRIRCEYGPFLDLVGRLRQPGEFFGLRHVRLTQSRPGDGEPIEVAAVLHAHVFRDPHRRIDTMPLEPEEDPDP